MPDMQETNVKIPIEKETLEMVLSILVHNRGDGRQCPFVIIFLFQKM